MNERRPAARAAWRILLPSRPLPLVATIFALVFFGLASGYGLAHGLFSKPLVGQKSNAATRGQAGANATELWFMTPQRSSYGRHESIGWDITLQDEDASTSENVRLAFVQYANDGKSPDASNAGEIVSLQVPVFGRGLSGRQIRSYRVTFGIPTLIPDRSGIEISLPAAPAWPSDGASVVGQLNLPNDPLRPRIPTPYDSQVWSFERPSGQKSPSPLGGRTLDALELSGLYIEPVLETVLESDAYGNGKELLRGPETMHPVASRGDRFGFEIQAGQIGSDGYALLYFGGSFLSRPIQLPNFGYWHLDFAGPLPFLWHVQKLDSLGDGTTPLWPFASIPPFARTLWAQCLIVDARLAEIEGSDVVGFAGL
jgi:hypothetical protein